jgi:hypothetical protein
MRKPSIEEIKQESPNFLLYIFSGFVLYLLIQFALLEYGFPRWRATAAALGVAWLGLSALERMGWIRRPSLSQTAVE